MGQLTSRQEIIHKEVGDPKMRNWLCANMAIREVSKHVARCVHIHIAEVHKSMRHALGDCGVCIKNCSSAGTERPWCTSCDRWRKEILSICAPHYRNQINWSRLHSSQWQINPYEVARAFIPRAHRLYYKSADFHEDFRFTLSFIENTREIPVPKGLREKLWQCRGRVKRKNLRMRMSDEELQGTIGALTEFVSLPVFEDSESLVAKINSLLNSHENDDGCSIM
ncbi:uncharacterized protein CXorf38-like [Biomphalaria glabrata]|uniref:Uncharacterized protein CXorf38-like n=1 Tax=Biomphalaria glabrata TaxID=6526 RepID=A0A9U8E0G7_BIOGL|nr:uncharacterized protein CXorf38-like [Biomphalaria glabrata]XP_013068104.2 uncharacterized protein CXorf38-like [Biomphalaria glabrata]XP_055863575.1 uncharacterized protein CXorf38-like [Biomphalaria glabrata]XP_055863576.1 uncharacterized protein CXorf38-like [Biomphalaria glabrata]